MASMALSSTLSKLRAIRVFLGSSPKPFQVNAIGDATLFAIEDPNCRFHNTTFSSSLDLAMRRRYGTMATYDEAAETAKQGRDAAKKGVDAVKKGGQQVKNEATAAADNVAQKTKGVAEKVSETAQDAAGKVKQTAQDAWGSVKDTTGKIKDTVVGKAEATADTARDTVRDEAAKVERCMNTKNGI